MAGDSDSNENFGSPGTSNQITLHANCVELAGQGLVILGASGSGKSGLSLELMALGATLVADDRVVVTRADMGLIAQVPDPLSGLIEARGIGILRARAHGPVPVVCVLDLDQTETTRMPPLRKTTVLGHCLPLLFKVETPHFPAALIQFLKKGRQPEP